MTFASNNKDPALRHWAFPLQTQILLMFRINANNRVPCVQTILFFLQTDGVSLLFLDTGDVINCYEERQFSKFRPWRRKSCCFTLVRISLVNVLVNWSRQKRTMTEWFRKGIWQKEMRQRQRLKKQRFTICVEGTPLKIINLSPCHHWGRPPTLCIQQNLPSCKNEMSCIMNGNVFKYTWIKLSRREDALGTEY